MALKLYKSLSMRIIVSKSTQQEFFFKNRLSFLYDKVLRVFCGDFLFESTFRLQKMDGLFFICIFSWKWVRRAFMFTLWNEGKMTVCLIARGEGKKSLISKRKFRIISKRNSLSHIKAKAAILISKRECVVHIKMRVQSFHFKMIVLLT